MEGNQETTGLELEVQTVENIVKNGNRGLFTTSLIIAQAFGKEHKNVLRDIDNLECSESFRQLNFELSSYSRDLGDGVAREYPMYRITRDGFAFLAMGFTGKRAAVWKERFLEAFNAMEAALRGSVGGLALPPAESQGIREQRIIKLLRGLTAYWAFIDKMPYQVAELALCAHMRIERLEDITECESERIQAAFDYLEKVSNHPTGGKDADRATRNDMIMLRHMLTACAQWRFARDQNFEEYFEKLTGVNATTLEALSSHDAEKMLSVAGNLLHQTYQHTVDWNDFAEKR